jgi:CRP-like cAMP-binding protein
MIESPVFLQYGEEIMLPPRSRIFAPGDPLGEKPVFYIVAGLIKLEFPLGGPRFPLYLTPDSIFGLVETSSGGNRLCWAQAMEKTIMYTWDPESFFLAAGVSCELAQTAITGMTRILRILNAEFGERLGDGGL